ncbi:MAG: HAMP domain-containing protein [Clostridiales bacterium]|nr:HAMP domain-containing protein [Clostridiales bacterium]
MFRSIRWKFVTIYFILVLIAMLVAGIFIIKEIDDLHISEASQELEGVRHVLMPDLQDLMELSQNKELVLNIIEDYKRVSFGINEEVWVIDDNRNDVIATTGAGDSSFLKDEDSINLMVKARQEQKKQELVIKDINDNRAMVQVYPITNLGENTGILFLRRDLSSVDLTVNKIREIIIRVIVASSLATIVLGFIISKSISDPIKDITRKAVLMSKGNFEHYVQVKSNDEIGELSETFNFLTRRLKKSLREISLEKTKVEAIVNHMTDGVIAVDNHHHIILMNPKAIELLNFGTEGYFETDFDKLIEPISPTLTYNQITTEVEDWVGTQLITIEDSIVKFNYAPYVNDQDEKTGIVYVLQDVTDAEKLDAMRRDFVANVSHELKTPLTSIKSYTETLMDGYVDDPETQKQFLKVIDSEAERMTRLVRDLLQLSNFDSHKITFYKEYNDYIDLARKCVNQLMMSAKKKNITIKMITTQEQLVGLFDLHRMEQVVINILSNAIKYTPENGSVDIQVIERDDRAIVRVKDNGIGIPNDDILSIFDRFYRVDKARTRNMGGTGLGLSIAKEIVHGHEGSIEIESEFGKGTVVIISIPMDVTGF